MGDLIPGPRGHALGRRQMVNHRATRASLAYVFLIKSRGSGAGGSLGTEHPSCHSVGAARAQVSELYSESSALSLLYQRNKS